MFHNCQSTVKENLCITPSTSSHADPNLMKTMQKMVAYMKDNQTNELIKGWESTYSIPDMMDRGGDLIYSDYRGEEVDTVRGDNDAVEMDDLTIVDL